MHPSPLPPTGQLLLAGGGHTHALMLLRWLMGRSRPGGAAITLVNRHSTTLYSGMVPGLVAGLYDRESCSIDLRRLCGALEVTFIQAEICGIATEGRQLLLTGRPPLHWDWLSLDVGASTASVEAGAIGVKPLEPFLAWLNGTSPAGALPIRGGGAAALELALALRGRGRSVELLLRGDSLQLGSRAAARRGEALLREAGVAVRRRAPDAETARLACTGSRAPAWLAAAGLPCDPAGRVRTAASLQVLGQPRLFAAGDCGVLADAPRPPSGVWAVRAAPILATNLARCLTAADPAAVPLRHWRPQRRALQLLADGSRPQQPRALALWGGLTLGPSRWLWHWKDRIDRRFMARFLQPAAMAAGAPMACRGCAAKLAAGPLEAALAQNDQRRTVEDAAVVGELAGGELLLQTVDGFPALVDDPWLNGRLSTLHACSDIWACGGRVISAQAIVTLPEAGPRLQQEWLAQTLAGIQSVLEPLAAELLGGHTLEGRDGAGLAVSLSVNGTVAKTDHWPKGPLTPGHVLILTRPLGTGVLFAAAMAAAARADWLEQALSRMQQSQAALVPVLRDHGCRACTDITGFGLLGHLGEMLAATPATLTVHLEADAIPALPGALALLEQGHASSLAPANGRALTQLGRSIELVGTEYPGLRQLLIDPQTCGPLLAALPADTAPACLEQLVALGFSDARCIGRVVASARRLEE
ncbi:MAG: selenide, water dikinase SelD [Chitinophagaceae bacterium]|nr:selenide, water dikinase SelD [Chitinophagaceae bacterium]